MNHRRPHGPFAAAVLTLASVLAGCGASAPLPSSAGTASSAPSPSADPSPASEPSPPSTAPATLTPASPSAVPWSPDAGAVERITGDLAELQAIADANGGIRTSGTAGYEASVDWAAAELRAAGWAVETPEEAFTGFRDLGASLVVGAATFRGPDEVRALIYSPSGTVRGPLTILEASGCAADDFADVAPGDVVLTTGAGCFRRDQALNAAAAEAAALVIGYPDRGPGEIFRPTLLDPNGITLPVVSVTGDAVAALEAAAGEVVTVTADTAREPATFRNVIAQLGEGPRTVMVGAHLDSVLDGPGINDNGSGVAAVLELARSLGATGAAEGWSIRIGLWGAEEFGLYGSRAYAASVGPDLVAYLNLDMAGSLNGATLVYDEPGAAAGSSRITDAYVGWLEARDLAWEPTDLGGGSDHFGFMQAGIPTGGLFAGAAASGSAANPGAPSAGVDPDPCYHIGCDTIDNVDPERVALFSDATAAVLLELIRR